MANHRDSPGDGDTGGFQLRRARLDIRGRTDDHRFGGRFRVAADRAKGSLALEYAYADLVPAPDWRVRAGQFKPLFLREEAVGSTKQLASERSYVADYFTLDYTQSVEVARAGDSWRPSLAFHDGSYGAGTEFDADLANAAVAGRSEFLLAGGWGQFRDFSGHSVSGCGVLIGLGADWEKGDSVEVVKATADISVELGGVGLFASAVYQHLEDAGAAPTADQLGLVAQAGILVTPEQWELFGRYERLDLDGRYHRNKGSGLQNGSGPIADDAMNLLTCGLNRYVDGHAARWTLDVLYALDPVPVKNTGAGLLASEDGDQWAARLQYQFVF